MLDINKTHQEQVTEFLAAHNLTFDQANALPIERKKELDTQFRAARKEAEAAFFGDANATKISRAALKRILPVGAKLTLVYAMGAQVSKPREVAEHRSYGFEFRTPEGKLSRLSFEAGETIWQSGNTITIRDKEGDIVVRYRLEN